MCRGAPINFSRYTSGELKAEPASCCACANSAWQFVGLVDHAHAAAAAAGRRLDDHRIADLFGHRQAPLPASSSTPGDPGSTGTPISRMKARARSLTPIRRITSGRGPMNLMPEASQTSREAGVLAQEAVAGVDGIDVGDFGGADDGGHVQIAARALGRADADGLVGEAHVGAVAVGLGIDGDGLDSQFLAGADDANGNFAPVGDEDLLKRRGRQTEPPRTPPAGRSSPACFR